MLARVYKGQGHIHEFGVEVGIWRWVDSCIL
jgi:hypothetical protein